MKRIFSLGCLAALAAFSSSAQDHIIHSFDRLQLTDEYYAEGGNFGDLNRDGVMDVVAGPLWHQGPDFKTKHEIYPPKPQNRNRYADNFFSWVYDFNGDGWDDVFVVGFPGTPAHWHENNKGGDGHWKKHQVFDWVSNESPHFTQLVGDERPELVCTRQGVFGYATVDWDAPAEPWTFHPISGAIASKRFGHGLGVGDVNGDGRLDVIHKDGWFEQPASLDDKWASRKFTFARPGGAQMFAYDVDGDGDNDVITSLAAHEHGLSWFEQVKEEGSITFKEHKIMGLRPKDNRYGVCFSELHAMDLADMDGDGLKDIVTGKTYWSHHAKTKSWHDGAVVFWFKLTRGKDGVDWIPYAADGDSGFGRQAVALDSNGNGLPDIVSSNMKGTFVLIHRTKNVNRQGWELAQPQVYGKNMSDGSEGVLPKDANGRSLNLDFEKGTLEDWTVEGEAFAGQPVNGEIKPERKYATSNGKTKRAGVRGDFWLGGFEIAESDKAVGTLTSRTFKVTHRYASFRLGGGAHPQTRVELILADGGRTVFTAHGRGSELMSPVTVDLSAVYGKLIFIRVVDEHTGGYGHINFDDFKFYENAPQFPEDVAMVKYATP